MEQNTQEPLLGMNVDYDAGNILKETTRWTRFISIVGFIGVGFGLLTLLIMLAAGQALTAFFEQYAPTIRAIAGLIVVALILVFALFAFMVYLLFRFSSLTRKGIESQDQEAFNKGLRALKTYFIISGILAILGLLGNLSTLTSL